MYELYERPFTEPPCPDEVVRAAMHWHFHPNSGSRFWLKRRESLAFDPIQDVRRSEDLALFPDISKEWRVSPIADLLPQGCSNENWGFLVFESGGTTGSPKRIVEMNSRRRGVEWVSHVLQMQGFPDSGDWLHIGPTGPHIVGRSIGLLAHLRRSYCHYIDFDPRWVRRCLHAGRADEAGRYVDHIIDQAESVLKSQPIEIVFVTPPILEAMCTRSTSLSLFQRKIRGLLWAGTSMSAETLRLIEDTYLPEARIVGLYGNTMLGIACQRPRLPTDTSRCIYHPFQPYCRIEVLSIDDGGAQVSYGERGRIRTTILTPEIFLPNNLERDCAVRVAPGNGFSSDGVAEVRPLPLSGQNVTLPEGVY
jgi:hypothetical protein